MRKNLLLLIVAVAACKNPPPVPPPSPTTFAPPVMALPEPVSPIAAPAAATPTAAPASTAPDKLLLALADHATPTVAALLADDVSVTLATGETCVGREPCLRALAGLGETKLQLLRRLQPAPDLAVLQGLAEVAGRRVPFAAVVVTRGAVVQGIRVYAATQAWRFVLDPPSAPLPPATAEAVEEVDGPPAFDVQQFATACDPVLLAQDATAAGRIATELSYRDTTAGTETMTAAANQAAIRAFQAAFAVENAELLAAHGAGDWLVVERVTSLRQRAPVVPVAPREELLHARTLEFALVQQGQIVQVWGYADPVAFAAAVEQPAIPPIH